MASDSDKFNLHFDNDLSQNDTREGIYDGGEPYDSNVLKLFEFPAGSGMYMSCVHQMLERAASLHPSWPAVLSDETHTGGSTSLLYNYGSLNSTANKLARSLHEWGVRRGDIVAVVLPSDCPLIPVAIQAVMKVGAAVCPIEANLNPANMKEHKITDTRSKTVLTVLPYVAECSKFCNRVLALDGPDLSNIMKIGSLDIDSKELLVFVCDDMPTQRDVAFVIYTSGSTGKPKGVEVEHRNLVQYTACVMTRFVTETNRCSTRMFNLTPQVVEEQERLATAYIFGFDAFVNVYMISMCLSGAWIILRRDTIVSGSLKERLTPLNLTYMDALPSLMRILFPGDLPTVKFFEVGGEALSKDVHETWSFDLSKKAKSSKAALFLNSYGPTECTITSCRSISIVGEPVHIGTAYSGYRQRVFVATETNGFMPAKLKELGEVFISGAGVTRGYLRRPDVTAKAFITFPDGVRWYRTGDEGMHIDNDGTIQLFGRIDAQVKIRGFRVELGEIEAAIMQEAGNKIILEVRCALVLPDSASEGSNKVLGAFIVLQPNVVDDEEERDILEARMKSACVNNLADYMVPIFWTYLKGSLPKSAAGKLDVSKLPRPKIGGENAAHGKPLWIDFNPYAGNNEDSSIAQIWTNAVTGSNESDSKFLAPYARFAALGGTSLAAALIITKMRKLFGTLYHGINVADVYKYETLNAFIGFASTQRKMARASEGSNLQHGDSIVVGPSTAIVIGIQVIQTFWLSFLFSIDLLKMYLPFAYYFGSGLPRTYFFSETSSGLLVPTITALIATLLLEVVIALFSTLLAILLKWIIIGSFKEGKFARHSWYSLRRWMVKMTIDELIPFDKMKGTQMMVWVLRALGMSIGDNVYMEVAPVQDFDLISIGSNTAILTNTNVNAPREMNNHYFEIGSVKIGEMCTIGFFTTIETGSELRNGVTLRPQTSFSGYAPDNTVWEGLPATLISEHDFTEYERVSALPGTNGNNRLGLLLWNQVMNFYYLIGYLLLESVELVPWWAEVCFIWNVGLLIGFLPAVLLAPCMRLPVMPFDILCPVVVKWILCGFQRTKPGVYNADDWVVQRQWLIDALVEYAHNAHMTMGHSILDIWFFVMMGGTVTDTRGVTITTWTTTNFEFITLEKGAFLGAEALVAPFYTHAGGVVTVGMVVIEEQALVGHLAIVSAESNETVIVPPFSKLAANVSICTKASQKLLVRDGAIIGAPAVLRPGVPSTIASSNSVAQQEKKFLSRLPYVLFYDLLAELPELSVLAFVFQNIIYADQSFSSYVDNSVVSVLEYAVLVLSMLVVSRFISPLLLAVSSWVLIRFKRVDPHFEVKFDSMRAYGDENYTLFVSNITSHVLTHFSGTRWSTLVYMICGANIKMNSTVATSELYLDDPQLATIGTDCYFGTDSYLASHTANAEKGAYEYGMVTVGDRVVMGASCSLARDVEVESGAIMLPSTHPMPGELIPSGTWVGFPLKLYVNDATTTTNAFDSSISQVQGVLGSPIKETPSETPLLVASPTNARAEQSTPSLFAQKFVTPASVITQRTPRRRRAVV